VPVRLKEFSNLNKLGIPISLQFLFEVGAFSFTAILVGRMGEISLAAHQIVITLASMTYMMASGIASASTIRIGHFVGLGDKEKILETGKKSMVLVIIFMSFTAALFLLFKTQIPLLFIEKEEVVLAAASLFSIAALFQISDGIQVVGLGCLRGLSDVKVPTLLTLFAYWVIAIPLGYWLGISQNMGLNGTWFGLFIGLTISAICMLLRFYLIARKFKLFIDINE
jgi:MATE family multidrug resistance protein